MKDRILFDPNIPHTLALEFPEGKRMRTGNVMFSLLGGRVMFLAPDVALKIKALGVKPGESFTICKRWNGLKGRASVTRWDVWRPAQAADEEKQADFFGVLEGGNGAVRSRLAPVLPMPTPAAPLAPTGTECAAVPALALGSGARKPGKIPFNVAFAEAVKIVQSGLQANGDQWNDEARQGMVSTILIAAANQGWLTVWERSDAA